MAASKDKLAGNARTTTVQIVMFGIVAGNFAISGTIMGYITIPAMILMMFGIGTLATRLGQRKGMLIGSIGGIIMNVLLALLWLFGDATTMVNAKGGLAFGLLCCSLRYPSNPLRGFAQIFQFRKTLCDLLGR